MARRELKRKLAELGRTGEAQRLYLAQIDACRAEIDWMYEAVASYLEGGADELESVLPDDIPGRALALDDLFMLALYPHSRGDSPLHWRDVPDWTPEMRRALTPQPQPKPPRSER